MANERLKIFIVTEETHGVKGLFEFYILSTGKKFLTKYNYCDIVLFKFEGSYMAEDMMRLINTMVYNEPYPRFSLNIQVDLSQQEFEYIQNIFKCYGDISYIKKKEKKQVTVDMGGEDPYFNYFTV